MNHTYRWADAQHTIIECVDDGTFIPAVSGNRHFDEILDRGQAISPFGGTPEAVAPDEDVADHIANMVMAGEESA